MSVNAPDWFQPQYENRAMHIYQNEGNRLRHTTTPATSFSGSDKAKWRLAGKSKAKKIGRNSSPENAGGDRKTFEAALETWQVFDEVYEYDLDRLNIDEREVIYQSGAMALGRATDIEIYDKMKVAVPNVPAALDFSGGAPGTTLFSAAHALTLCGALQDDKVPWNGRVYCGLPSVQWNQFIANKVVNSADHVGPGGLPFVQATDNRFWNGVNWFLQVEEDPEDLYPMYSANQQDLFIWHQSAMGWGLHTDLSMIPQWDNRGQGGGCWTINMKAKGAATTLQEGKGVKRFRTGTKGVLAIV